MVGEGEVLLEDGGGVDIWENCYMYGVDYCPLDLLACMAVHDGVGVVVIRGGGCVARWCGVWSGEDEIKRDECGDGCDGGGDGVVHTAKVQKSPSLRAEAAACQAALRGARS